MGEDDGAAVRLGQPSSHSSSHVTPQSGHPSRIGIPVDKQHICPVYLVDIGLYTWFTRYMDATQNLTPAAKRELASAAASRGWTGSTLRNGPRAQLIEAGLAEPIMQTNGQLSWDVRLTEAGWAAAGVPQAKPHTTNGEWCECPACAL